VQYEGFAVCFGFHHHHNPCLLPPHPSLKQQRDEPSTEETLNETDLEDQAAAATKIQASFRGYKARKELNEANEVSKQVTLTSLTTRSCLTSQLLMKSPGR
jgi:hypothetical protein